MRILAILALMIGSMVGGGALAHHGWAWTTGGKIELTGVIRSVRLGNPHGVLDVDVEGERWTLEVGQPWRNARAGLRDGDLAQSVEIRAVGEPSADPSQRLLKVITLYLGSREFVLYTDREL